MRINDLTKDTCTHYGEGPERSLFVLHESTGLGTVPHAMPTLWNLKQQGYSITVNCRPFQVPMYETLGIVVTSEHEPFGPYRTMQLLKTNRRIVTCKSWDGWECWDNGTHEIGTMEEYANILHADLPESFSWLDLWKPQSINKPSYILFNPNAYELWRSLPSDVADKIESELRKYADVVRIKGSEYPDWQTLRDITFNARTVVTVEGGISNVAGAMNVPMVIMAGVTDAEPHVGQYRRYIRHLNFIEIKGFQPNGCAMPCYRQPSKGFINNKCLGVNTEPLCLKRIDVDRVIESTLTLYEHGNVFERSN